MGRSPSSSCLKIIACGSDTAENDDIDASEAKTSGDKRGWSFRKRSGRHRVIGNNVSSETATVTDKEIPQGINTEFQAPVKSNSPDEKSHLPKPVEKTTEAVYDTEHVSESKTSMVFTSENDGNATYAESKTSPADVTVENGTNTTSVDEEMASPTVVSGNDVNTELAEPKIVNSEVVLEVDSDTTSSESEIFESVVASETGGDTGAMMDEPVAIMIQTAIRGFLGQRAFVQLKSAIKLQAAIRGHLVRRNAVQTLHCIRSIVKIQALVRARSSKSLDHKNKPSDSQFSTVKLLRNGFARQLLVSTPKPKSVNIRCDPLKPNSAWGWLERWMSVSISEVDQKLEPTMEPEDDNQVQETSNAEFESIQVQETSDAEFEPLILSDSVTSKFNTTEVAKSHEHEENDISNDVSNVDTLSCHPLSTEVKTEQIQEEPLSPVDKPALESEQPKPSNKRPAPKEFDGEEKKFVYGSKKASNPAFIAAQSKFEELTSAAKSVEETVKKTHEPTITETAPCDPLSRIAASECGTELSISSTLDSPVRSDFENAEAEQNKLLLDTSHDANGMTGHHVTDLPSVPIQWKEAHSTNGISVDPVVEVSAQEDQKLEMNSSDLQTNLEPVSSEMATDSSQMEQKHELNGFDTNQGFKSSPEASPKSHRTVPESQGTPSSQASVKSKRNKSEKSGSKTKRSSLSGGKRSPSTPGLDSGARSSSENLTKDHKIGKRSSFGPLKSENVDEEPRDSTSRISLPNYMQATESARAKVHSNSPRSSPDVVHDKEVSSKKRHSLPGASGRQGSPRIQRSTSQAAQGAKANGSNERKWQR